MKFVFALLLAVPAFAREVVLDMCEMGVDSRNIRCDIIGPFFQEDLLDFVSTLEKLAQFYEQTIAIQDDRLNLETPPVAGLSIGGATGGLACLATSIAMPSCLTMMGLLALQGAVLEATIPYWYKAEVLIPRNVAEHHLHIFDRTWSLLEFCWPRRKQLCCQRRSTKLHLKSGFIC